MTNNPWVQLVMIGIAGYVTKLWTDDYRADRRGQPNPNSLPGAVPASNKALMIGLIGAWLILAAETWGEAALGVAGEQSRMTWLFASYTLLAGVIEEIIFRGYLVVEKRGRAALWGGIVLASLLFALLHPHLWEWKDSRLIFHFGAKAVFTTTVLFVSSLWFYCARFAPFNPTRSLLPCFAAHAGKNLGVIVIKASQGYMAGLW
jgi:membrane protease YdiL (CAAX protease family)